MQLKQRQQLLKDSILGLSPNAKFVAQYGVSNSAKLVTGGIQACGPNLAKVDENTTEFIFSCLLNLPLEIEIYFSIHIKQDIKSFFDILNEMKNRSIEDKILLDKNNSSTYVFNPTKNNNNVKIGLAKNGRIYLRNKAHWEDLSIDLKTIGGKTGNGIAVDKMNIAIYPNNEITKNSVLVQEFVYFLEQLIGKEKINFLYPWPKDISHALEPSNELLLPQKEEPSSIVLEERTSDNQGSGLELEILDSRDSLSNIPFDPSKIDVITQARTVDLLLTRLKEDELDLSPDFQRRQNLWNNEWKSSLIESMLLRIPIPSLYVSEDKDGNYIVVDGLQRFCAISHFVDVTTLNSKTVTKLEPLRLTNLQSLKELEGLAFEDLPRPLKRRILETELTLHVIRASTPEEVKFSIFSRINKGGLALTAQEIRSAVYSGGSWLKVVSSLTKDKEFLTATDNKIKTERMQDAELVLRFIALYSLKGERDKNENLDDFLNHFVEFRCKSWTNEDWNKVIVAFRKAMAFSSRVFGRNAFRKHSQPDEPLKPINRGMFEAQAVVLAKHSERDLIYLSDKHIQLNDLIENLFDDNKEFISSLLYATGRGSSSNSRIRNLNNIFKEILNAP